MKKFTFNFWLIVAIIVVLIGGVVYLVVAPKQYQPAQQVAEVKNYDYRLENFVSGDKKIFLDERLVRKDVDSGAEIVLIPNVKEKYGKFFSLLSYIKENNTLILDEAVPDTDNPGGAISILNLDTLEIKEPKINEIIGDGGDFGVKVVSPDKTKMAWVPVPLTASEKERAVATKLFVADLVKDTYYVAVELGSGENFNSNNVGGLSTNVFVEWLNDETIRYAVYELLDIGNYQSAPLIGYREIRIK